MPKITFIRHAEPDRDGHLSAHGKEMCERHKYLIKPTNDTHYFTSYLSRSIETMQILYPDAEWTPLKHLNEWDKDLEKKEEFLERVESSWADFSSWADLGIWAEHMIVVGHSRYMSAIHWILKKEPALGFDYLEHFEHEF